MRTCIQAVKTESSQKLSGWLVSQTEKYCYHFHSDQESRIKNSLVFVDKWSIQQNGTPLELESRHKLPLDDALELCGQMLMDGWGKLNHKLNAINELDYTEEAAA